MHSEWVTVTPKLARQFLKNNLRNRVVRQAHVDTLRISFERGEYVPTHQGIAFDSDGNLIDGQHRLFAISELPEDMQFRMLVTTGLDPQDAFGRIDGVLIKRTVADNLRIDSRLGEVGSFLARLYLSYARGLTPSFVEPFVQWVQPEHTDLIAFCGTVVRAWSSAPVRAAAVLAMKRQDADYAKLVYRALVMQDFETMPKVAQALFRAYVAGTVRASNRFDFFVRCTRVFDPDKTDATKVQVRDIGFCLEQVRAMLTAEIPAVSSVVNPAQRRGRLRRAA